MNRMYKYGDKIMPPKKNKPVKSVIITGGNTGLGYQCAKSIASNDQEYQVIIACRNAQKSEYAVKQLKTVTGNNNITWLPLAALAVSPLFNNITGSYFEGTAEIKSSHLSYNKENAENLWDTSVSLVKLADDETILSI